MLVSDFDYELPERLIAQEPAARRDQSQLLVVDRAAGTFTDSTFDHLPEYLRQGDVLVLNNTRVFPARLIGRRLRKTPRGETILGGRVEVFLTDRLEPLVWEALVRPGRQLLPGAEIEFARGKLTAEIVEWREHGRRLVRFHTAGDFDEIIDRIGRTPLPPYIKRDEEDRLDQERYQTVYARERGAVAAPTAGLHFTPELLERIRARGVEVVEITLHVGYGTFQPVRVERVEEHRIEAERYEISETAAAAINRALSEGRRVIAVGTTTTRALESAARRDTSSIAPGKATTELFIYPGFEFRVISGLITNFHLPQSSLLMLVSAFGGRELILQAYRHAVEHDYRFYSYGDAMLIM
ncbi:MAG TPA: tRNA preQ1(34) S-adenosylmethionine ribosyltransferase-isomerase QueA [Blastocatellia bacterium]|nr:tRNA preQ1(34) S-adenosylmethionine ribosyltransferase-isomerase QueA [Blastocatellia bacterium]